MSKLSKKDLHTPFNGKSLDKIAGYLLRGKSEQATAASLAADPMRHMVVATQNTTIQDLYLVSSAAAASGESMVFDVLVNGASILTSTYTYNSASAAATQIKLPVNTAKRQINTGDRVTVTRTYTAGGTPSMAATAVVLESSPNYTE